MPILLQWAFFGFQYDDNQTITCNVFSEKATPSPLKRMFSKKLKVSNSILRFNGLTKHEDDDGDEDEDDLPIQLPKGLVKLFMKISE